MSLTPGGMASALGPHAGTLEHLLLDDCFRTATNAHACGDAQDSWAARQASGGGRPGAPSIRKLRRLPIPKPGDERTGELAPLEALVLRCQMLRSLR